MWESRSASPNSARRDSTTASGRSSVAGASSTGSGSPSSGDDNGLTLPTLGHVLVADPVLKQHDALQQRLRPRRAAGHVDVDGDDLIHALGDGVAVPVGPAA